MGMSINTNVSSLNAQRSLASSQGSLQTSMQRLSTGLRINSAKDDASGLAIAERMNTQVKGMNQAMRNANEGISMLQTVDGALGKIGDTMQRMRELAVQAANGTNSATDYINLDAEFTELKNEVTRVLDETKYNGKYLLDEQAAAISPISFQVGANNTTGEDQIDVTLENVQSGGNGNVSTAISATLTDQTTSKAAINALTDSIDNLNKHRSKYGAIQNRFESVISTLQVASENVSASRGRIMDTDFATETANLSRAQVLQQAGTAMLAQANQSSQNVMQLLR